MELAQLVGLARFVPSFAKAAAGRPAPLCGTSRGRWGLAPNAEEDFNTYGNNGENEQLSNSLQKLTRFSICSHMCHNAGSLTKSFGKLGTVCDA